VPVEMIGWIAPRVSSELIPSSGPPFVTRFLFRALEALIRGDDRANVEQLFLPGKDDLYRAVRCEEHLAPTTPDRYPAVP
jgi:hypothetical protein